MIWDDLSRPFWINFDISYISWDLTLLKELFWTPIRAQFANYYDLHYLLSRTKLQHIMLIFLGKRFNNYWGIAEGTALSRTFYLKVNGPNGHHEHTMQKINGKTLTAAEIFHTNGVNSYKKSNRTKRNSSQI